MPETHALLSASSSKRWIACPPSARIAAEFPDRESEAAEEGTKAHQEAEDFFRKWKLPTNPHVQGYVRFIQELVKEYGGELCIEEQVDFSHIVPRGFGTLDCGIYTQDLVHIVDFKYGEGVLVESENNTQLLLYARGFIKKYKLLPEIIRMTIYQPRINNIETWEITYEELINLSDEIRAPARLAWAGLGEFKAGDHCGFCPAKAFCQTFKNYFDYIYGI